MIMAQNEEAHDGETGRFGARDLIARLYREIGISAVAAALESNKRAQKTPEDPAQNPAVLREERAA